ncbi:PAS domain-containing sensor histidine kinase [Clostridium massiliodielmoense]|uniref:sensor histidine kinase n=1 Tax=Clostridium massiliodielmoense TaxID=1776385 RepID=UPI00016666DA|nr:PAS domain-containing sensor histidine kinase [Clostridium massiliodielmoense]EDS76788.1 two-component sensor histidine kinase [Clostridium botulinum C str. Eklund]NEZ49356.1 PAS domain S-box protein [Clostridium botulinum]
MKRKINFTKFFYTFLFAFILFNGSYYEVLAHDVTQKHILIINSYDKCIKRSEYLIDKLIPILKSSNESLDINIEYMDTKSFNNSEYIENLYTFYKEKFRQKKFDLIVSIDDDSLNFLKKYNKSLFPNTPIVFTGANFSNKSILKNNPFFTGMIEYTPLKETIDMALSLNKNTKNVIVINDNSSKGLSLKKSLDDIMPSFKGIVNFIFLDNINLLHNKEFLNNYSKNSIVLLLSGFTTDYSESIFIDNDTILSTRDFNIPMYSIWEMFLGHGVLGGKMISREKEAEILGNTALRILKGENPNAIPIITTPIGNYKFDYNLITKFDIPMTLLPYKSSFINLKPLSYTIPKILVLLFIIFIITLCIFLSMSLYEKHNTRTALIESEKRLRTLINSSPDLICLKDGNCRWLEINKATVNFLNLKNIDWKNKTTEQLINLTNTYKNRLEKYKNFDFLTLKQKSIINYQDEFFSNNGSKIVLDIFKVPIFDSNNNPSGLVTIGHDLTPHLKAEENKKLLDEALSYQQLRTKFFANISHELKTPLNLILSAIQFLQSVNGDSSLRTNFNKYGDVIKENSYRMVRIINNILDITKIDSGYFEIHPENYNIVEVVEDICLYSSSYINSKNLEFIFDTDTEEKIIACDPHLIERIILNLLSNAIKFTNAGGKITVNMYDKGDFIDISIKDTGIGIPKNHQKIIFERFVQIDKSLSRNQEGSGVGLSLVKSFVDLHNGFIKLNSKVGHGSEFIITLPSVTIKDSNINLYSDISPYEFKSEKLNIEFSDIY